MKAMILAAGLGTRLRPWTLEHPKALVPVDGVPMLERVIMRLREQGFDDIVVNIHHFGEQIIDFLKEKDFGGKLAISDERGFLLDTGGALIHAASLLRPWDGPVLIHNVDILSDADLQALMSAHREADPSATLLVSERESSRKLIFGKDMTLRGWHNLSTDDYRPEGFIKEPEDREYAFSGIHVVGEKGFEEMTRLMTEKKFSIMDYYLHPERMGKVQGYCQPDLHLIDIGKPATLSQANRLFGS